jgi:hypothetical protein
MLTEPNSILPNRSEKSNELEKKIFTEKDRESFEEYLKALVVRGIEEGLSYQAILKIVLHENISFSLPLSPDYIREEIVNKIFEKYKNIPPASYFKIVKNAFSYEFYHEPTKIRFIVRNPYYEKKEIKGFLEVISEHERCNRKNIYRADFNFYSSRAENMLFDRLKSACNYCPEDYLFTILQNFKKEFLKQFKTTSSITSDKELSSLKPEFLWEPFILKNGINLIYGAGSTGKSIFACYLATLLEITGKNVMYIDYENQTAEPILRTLKKIHPTTKNIIIKNPLVKLIDIIEELNEEIKERKIEVVFVDSVIYSMVTDVFSPEQVALYVQTLMKVPVTWVLLSHVSKTGGENPDPYGSIFFFNSARNVWYAKRITNKEGFVLQLIHKKSNYTKLYPSKIFEVNEDDRGHFIITEKSIMDLENTSEMILHLLEEKPMTTGEIAKALPSIKYQTIQKTLDRLQKKRKIKKEGQTWELVSSELEELPF